MSDPFFGLDMNNLQTINVSNNSRLQQTMSKPLISSHLPQLPQQQMKSTLESSEEECNERKKFEKYRKFQLQQKRLQEMSFSMQPTTSSSSADQMMANLIQKVESEAKLDKRINYSHRTGSQPMPNTNPLMANNMSLISGSGQTSNSYVMPYVNAGQNVSTVSMTTHNQMNNNCFNGFNVQNSSQTSYTPNQSLKTTPILQQIFTNTESQNIPLYGQNGSENSYNNWSQINTNQTLTSHKSNSDHMFSNNPLNAQSINVHNPCAVKHSTPRRLPHCFEDMAQMPALYMTVWHYVKVDDMSNVCDTNKLYPVLLSVGLAQPVLAQLWSVANNTIPGQLTQTELFMTLSLIALIQKKSINPLEEIYKLSSLPIPSIEFFSDSVSTSSEVLTQPTDQTFNEFKQNVLFSTTNGLPQSEQNLSQLSADFVNCLTEDTNNDDFDDFKSADFTGITSTDIQPINELTSKQTLEPMAKSDVNDVIEDEFDDFKSARIDETIHSLKIENEFKTKTNQLSDALMSNMSALSSAISHQNSDPILTISSTNSVQSFDHNISKLSPVSIETPEPIGLDSTSGSVDKYSVFRELSTENQTKNDDFGNFLSHANNCESDCLSVDSLQFGHQENNDYNTIESISFHLIQSCRQLIHKVFNVLVVSHGEDSVLEAFQSKEGQAFALDLAEVYAIVQRVAKSLKSMDKLNDNLIKMIEDIDNTWNPINSVFTKASIDIDFKDKNSGLLEDNTSHCALCGSKASSERPVLSFAGHEYHTSCANLWLNCINPTLPTLPITCR